MFDTKKLYFLTNIKNMLKFVRINKKIFHNLKKYELK